jgi:hypothetical protein
MARHLESLREICERRDLGALIVALKEAVPDYGPSAYLLRRMLESRTRAAMAATA